MIKLNDVRFQGDFIAVLNLNNFIKKKHEISSHFIEKKITRAIKPFSLKSFLKLRFLAFDVENISFMQTASADSSVQEDCLCYTTVQDFQIELHADAGKKNTASLLLKTDGVTIKILKHLKDNKNETCLANLSFNMFCNIIQDEFNEFIIALSLQQTQLMLYEALPLKGIAINRPADNQNFAGFFQKLRQIPIKQLKVEIVNSSLKLVRERGQKALNVNLSLTEGDFTKLRNNELEARLIVSRVKISSTQTILTALSRFSAIVKVEPEKSMQNLLNLYIISEIVSCHVTHNDVELNYWLELVQSSEDNPELEKGSDEYYVIDDLMKGATSFGRISFSCDISDVSFSLTSIEVAEGLVTYGFSHTKVNCVVNPDPLFREVK